MSDANPEITPKHIHTSINIMSPGGQPLQLAFATGITVEQVQDSESGDVIDIVSLFDERLGVGFALAVDVRGLRSIGHVLIQYAAHREAGTLDDPDGLGDMTPEGGVQ